MTTTLIGTRAFAERFDMSINEVQRRAKAGRLPGAYKVDGHWKFDPDEYLVSVKGARKPAGRPVTVKRVRR